MAAQTKYKKFMVIEQTLLEKWQKLRSAEDTGRMAERMEGGYAELFARAFRTGECSDKVFKIMADFYEEKVNLIKQYL